MNFETQNYFKALVESLPDIVWSFDQHYKLTAANTAFFDLRKNTYQQDLEIGDDFFKGVPQAGIDKWKPIYEKVLKGERLIIEDERDVNRQHAFVEISLNPVYNEKKEVIGCMGITHDVTRIYEHEVALNQYRKVVDKIIKSADYSILPKISKILVFSQQLNNPNNKNKDDLATVLFMMNNELLELNKELTHLIALSNGAKNL
ncbi:MAG: PAS domain S-box protein [Bacteroidota bacterium]|nr:PAS domain S-box protein [Bacteroidota bacterium]